MPRPKGDPTEQYERKKRSEAARQRAHSSAAADIGEIPPPVDLNRRARCLASTPDFLKTYFPNRYPLPFSADHYRMIDILDRAIEEGGQFAVGMARGRGKTAICVGRAIKAILEGKHSFVMLVGATGDHAKEELLGSIKTEFETNELLLEDFPEVCVPIRKLEGKTQRARGQTHNGCPTRIQWKSTYIVFPSIDGSASSEAVIKVAGLTGRIRGMTFTRSDGKVARPTHVIVDDPQTDRSAMSPLQCDRRMKLLNGAIHKLAGHEQKISVVCPCTVIRLGDMADQLLNRDANPHWQGLRCKTVYAFPTRMDRWREYAVLRAECLRTGANVQGAVDFYIDNRAEMDAGAHVAWPEYHPGDVSALQSAMHAFFDDRYSFEAELQNTPIDEERREGDLKPGEVAVRFSGRSRGRVPIWASKLTAFVDVQQSLLYWLVAAWDPANFTGTVIDYGTWPDQPGRTYYTLADAQHTIQNQPDIEDADLKGQIDFAIKTTVRRLLAREWLNETDTSMRIDRLLVDSGFEMDVVFEAIRSMGLANVMPSRGQPIGAKNKPMAEFKVTPGDQRGFHWFVGPQRENKRGIRWAQIDVNFWKSFLVQRLRQSSGEAGALTLFGQSRQDADHGMIADHITAERGVEVEANGRKITEWELRVGRPDNHWLDCLVGAAVAASIEGAVLVGQQPKAAPKRQQSFAAAAREQRAKLGRR